jgi:hypothetical protein
LPEASIVCVMGMHRSGTSFAACALGELGVALGQESQLMGPGPDNAAGYWENRHIKELDDELLAALGGSWDQPPALSPGWERDPALDEFRVRAKATLEAAFEPDDRRGWLCWKDPRLSVILPFWRTVVDVDRTIQVLRDPLEVSASLGRRNGLDPAHVSLLWLRYVLAAADGDPDQLRIDQQALLDDLPRQMERMAAHLGLRKPEAEAIERAEVQLDRSLHHHHAPEPPSEPDPLTALAMLVWNDGEVDLDALGQPVRHAVATGWLRSPTETAALDQARAKVVELTERLRKRSRARKAAAASRQSP